MKRFLICLTLIYAVLFNLACPFKKADLEKMKDYSRRVATGAHAGVELTRTLFREKVISAELTSDIADGFIYLAQGGQFVDAQLERAIKNYGKDAPPDIKKQIVDIFRSDILNRFLAVIEQLKLARVTPVYYAVLESIKTTVILTAGLLGIGQETKIQIEGAIKQ
jgi:hypothetical protein